MKIALKFTVLFAILLASCQPQNPVELPTPDEADMTSMPKDEIVYTADLVDVNEGNASGQATATFSELDAYVLTASFENLPELEDDFFYEGWIVIPGVRFISTGELTRSPDEGWMNIFSSEEDMTEYSRYVLTLEPDDGDPAPAKHIVDGDFKRLN